MVQLFSHRPATGTAYRADGQRIATAGEDGTVTLWDASLKRVELRFQAHERYKYCDVFSPDRTSLATLGDGMAKPWDVTKLDSLANVDVPAKHVPSEVSASQIGNTGLHLIVKQTVWLTSGGSNQLQGVSIGFRISRLLNRSVRSR